MDYFDQIQNQEEESYKSYNSIICSKCCDYMLGEKKEKGILWSCECGNKYFEEIKKDD